MIKKCKKNLYPTLNKFQGLYLTKILTIVKILEYII